MTNSIRSILDNPGRKVTGWPVHVTSDGSLLPWTQFDYPRYRYPRIKPFVPVITEADIDAYLACDSKPTSYGDPRDGFTESDLPYVLTFLGWVAQFKAMDAPQSDPGHFGYETMLYAYHNAAEAIAEL